MELSTYNSTFSLKNKVLRLVWNIFALFFFKPFNLKFFERYRCFILNLFGAEIDNTAIIYSSAKIWAPWNLKVGAYSTIGPNVDCYNQGQISIGDNCVISQKTFLCASSHDYRHSSFPLILCPITIYNGVWVAADSFIGPGVTIHNNVIVGARSAVFKDCEANSVYGGNPAVFLKVKSKI